MKKPRYKAKLNFQNEKGKDYGKSDYCIYIKCRGRYMVIIFNHGIGVVVSISIIGAFLIYQNENKKTSKKEGIPLLFLPRYCF